VNGHRPVCWSQGLFLHPQHLQASDEAFRRQVDSLRRHGLPHFWGVRRLAFRNSDVTHSLEVETLEAILPSGAAISVPFDASLPPMPLGDWPEPDRPGTCYLGLALPDSAGNNASVSAIADGKRFAIAETPDSLPDAYGTAPPAPVSRLRYAPVLIKDVDRDRYPHFEMFPLARLRRQGTRIEFDAGFIPPLLCLDANLRLAALLQEVQDAAMSCAARLASYKHLDGSESLDMDFLLNFTALGILNRHVPVLAHLREAPGTHPWHAYGQLRQFAGELSLFFEDMDCLGRSPASLDAIPQYCHERPEECFVPLCSALGKLMATLGLGVSRVLPLVSNAPYFSADIPENFISPVCRCWLSVRAEGLGDSLADQFPRFAKLGTRDRLRTIIAKAVSGVPLTRSRRAPPGFVKRPNMAWYAVDMAHPLWQDIIEHRDISLFWEGAPEGTQMQLISTGR
jgi:type VI secretion system protein ImpJ